MCVSFLIRLPSFFMSFVRSGSAGRWVGGSVNRGDRAGRGRLAAGWLVAGGWLLGLTAPASAQRTLAYAEPDYHFRAGLELFEKHSYDAARFEFAQFLERPQAPVGANGHAGAEPLDPNRVAAGYYLALASLYLDEPGAELLADRFVRDHGDDPRAGQLYGELGRYYETTGDYVRATTYYEKALAQAVSPQRRQDYAYRLALAYYNARDGRRALPLFDELKTADDPAVADPSAYYAGVIRFQANDFANALPDFRRLDSSPAYADAVPNFMATALYKLRRYDELTAYAEPLLRAGRNLPEVALVAAEVYYQQGNYAGAATSYRRYATAKAGAIPPAVRFRYGQSLLRTGATDDAILQLKPLTAGADTVAQYAAFTLGVTYLQRNNPAFAATAFEQAGRLGFSKAIQEEARFTHAKLLLDQRDGSGAVRELTEFAARYPDSRFGPEAANLTGEAYVVSNNYQAAVAYIEGLKRRSPELNATYQQLTYRQATADFNAERYDDAIRNLDKSLTVTADPALRQAAQYWKAEALSALRQYDVAIAQYGLVTRSGDAYDLRSRYGLGYAYYNKKDYDRALPLFRDYVAKAGLSADTPAPAAPAGGTALAGLPDDPADRQATLTDALLRLADCYFVAKQYEPALQTYDRAIARAGADTDYATYQQGLIYTYQGRDPEAKARFAQLARQYPGSRFADDALFQTANVDFEKGAYPVAIAGYSTLIQTRPKSYLLPAALLKRAVAYDNLSRYDEAIADYNRILTDFGGSVQAASALLGVQNSLNDANRADEFGAILAQYKRANPTGTDVEAVELDNARNLYTSRRYPQAIGALLGFLQTYPASAAGQEARYYLADAYRLTNDLPNALRYYYLVMADAKETFTVRAAARAAELEKQQRNYDRAAVAYHVLFNAAEGKNDQLTALLGLMDVYLAVSRLDSAGFYARAVLTGGNTLPGAPNRAQLALGKIAQARGDYRLAQTELERVIVLAKDVSGAEANYLIGEGQYKLKKYKESIATLLRFNDQFTDEFDYWKGRAFLLIADDNLALNEPAQARAVLQSILDNATNPEIKAEAERKLRGIRKE
jgi:tetratricopeptide (TPR) repeat protein